MADIAVIFHWSPEVMDLWTVPELIGWREQAARRAQPEER